MDRAYARLWANYAAQKICPTFFRIILAQVRPYLSGPERHNADFMNALLLPVLGGLFIQQPCSPIRPFL